MRVKCIENMVERLPSDSVIPYFGVNAERKFHVLPQKEYIVYAIMMVGYYPWYLLCDEWYTHYPNANPCQSFDVVDNRISRHWRFGYRKGGSHDDSYTVFAFKEWIENPYYYDELTDGEEGAVAIFRRYKALMDLEFPDPTVNRVGKSLADNWILCPCSESLEVSSKDAMARCPACGELMHNPIYSEDC